MSELIPHECGIAYIRLRKPLSHFAEVHGDALYGWKKLSLLMQKQRNRGQDGVGIGCCKVGMASGSRYLFHQKSVKRDAVSRVFEKQMAEYQRLVREKVIDPADPTTIKEHFDFGGENLVGHLRYTTSGGVSLNYCHPQVLEANWATKTLLMLGNFNLTNVGDLKRGMQERGQTPFHDTDTQVVLEEVGYHLEKEHSRIYERFEGTMRGREIPKRISEELDLVRVVRESAEHWDGGYVMVGLVGDGSGFVLRDPHGIRPCFYFADEEMVVFASERTPLMTVFEKQEEEIEELDAGHVACLRPSGEMSIERFANEQPRRACSFERIYFSRGNDADIYRERRKLGEKLVPQVLDAIDGDLGHTVFSFVPNTAETGYYGLMDGLRKWRRRQVRKRLGEALEAGMLTEDMLDETILQGWPRDEKVATKDEKFRTFISREDGREELVSLASDITYGRVHAGKDNLVVLDDSIVRGTTLKRSVIRILTRAEPKKIVVVSTAPQIRYPDFYGIDMSELGQFLAFRAAETLLKESDRHHVLE
ncbi:MAG: amidophosphoribosyltransferase [Verrucomicrobiota bacterium]